MHIFTAGFHTVVVKKWKSDDKIHDEMYSALVVRNYYRQLQLPPDI